MTTAKPTARQIAREQITEQIREAGRQRLATDGPAGLSLRGVARDVGMVSSAVYRYFSSRNELLTALLIDAYNQVGVEAEAADAAVADRSDTAARWFAACRAVRAWALQHPSEYALLYGSPVPDYAAPQDTVEPAARVVTVLLRIVGDSGHVPTTSAGSSTGAESSTNAPLSTDLIVPGAVDYAHDRGIDLDEDRGVALLEAWSGIFGAISFELFGHFVGSVADTDAFFTRVVARHAAVLGVA